MTRKKHTYDEVKKDFEEKGYILLTQENEYKNSSQKLKYICPVHGEQEISYSHLKQGQGCYLCGRERTRQASLKPDSYYKNLAESKGFEFIDIKYKNNKRYVGVVCPVHREKGNQLIQIGNLHRNKGCKYCAGNAKLTDDDKHIRFVEKVYSVYGNAVTVVSKYINQKTKIECVCNIHNETNFVLPNNLTSGHNGCSKCRSAKKKKINLKTHDVFEKEVAICNPHIKLLEKYVGVSQNIKCLCTIHNQEFTKYAKSLIERHTGCDECYRDEIRKRMSKTTEQFKKELNSAHPELEVLGEYINRYTSIKLRCKIHNYEFESAPCDILSRISCCPKSIKYIKEKTVGDLLDKWNIKYVAQKSFSDCRDINALPFDYYLTDLNILIEYQGEQHYKPVKFGTQKIEEAKKKFQYTQLHDQIKKMYCLSNDIPLIEIPYWEYENMEAFLYNELKKLNAPI